MTGKLARRDLSYFTEQFGYVNAPFQVELYKFLQYDFGPYNDLKKFLILWPRGHGKTQCASINYPAWLIGNNPNINIHIVSKTAEQSEQILSAVKMTLLSEQYQKFFPRVVPEKPDKWSVNQITVNRDGINKNPTVKASGMGGPITGGRSDIIIGDDLIDEENVRTPLQLEKAETWFNKVLFPTLQPWGAVLVIGTRWHYADLYTALLAKWPNSVKQAIDEKGNVLWPDFWSGEKLAQRREEIGSVFFNCQYLNNPSGMRGDLLNPDWIRRWSEPPPINLPKYAGVDPALGEGDMQSIATLSYDRKLKQAYLEDVWAKTVSFPQFLDQLKHLHEVHRYSKIYFESNAFQKVLTYLQELQGLPIVPSPTVGDKEKRIIPMSSHFEAGRVLVNPILNQSSEFWNQWVQFPRGVHDDALDAVEIVVREVVGAGFKPWVFSTEW